MKERTKKSVDVKDYYFRICDFYTQTVKIEHSHTTLIHELLYPSKNNVPTGMPHNHAPKECIFNAVRRPADDLQNTTSAYSSRKNKKENYQRWYTDQAENESQRIVSYHDKQSQYMW